MMRLISWLIAAAVALYLLLTSFFVVDQRQDALVFSFGELMHVVKEPGLHFKWPQPFQNVVILDKRLQMLDTPEGDRFNTSEKKDVQVDAFIKWQIADPKLFFVSVGGDLQHAYDRLAQMAKAALNDEIARHTVQQVVSTDRDAIMSAVQKKVAQEASQIGVNVVDVRLKHVDYSDQITSSIYDRMKAERLRIANELRSTGAADGEKLRADADRQRTVILAEAYRDAETVRGEGDAKASQIYAQAFGQNPEFYKFYRSLEAYRASFKNRSDVLVVEPNSEFFKYFKDSGSPGNGKK